MQAFQKGIAFLRPELAFFVELKGETVHDE